MIVIARLLNCPVITNWEYLEDQSNFWQYQDFRNAFYLVIFTCRAKLADAEIGGEECANYLLRILPLNDVEECFQWQSTCPSSKLILHFVHEL